MKTIKVLYRTNFSMSFVIIEVKSSDVIWRVKAPQFWRMQLLFSVLEYDQYTTERSNNMQCSIGALCIIILFFETRNYIKFKFYIIAGKKRPPQLRKSGRLFPQLARCGLFCALSFRALGTVQRTMGRSYQCCAVRQQKTIHYFYLISSYSIWNLL